MPASNDFNASAYLARYPDLKTGYVYKAQDGTWKYGKPTNRELKQLAGNLFWHWQNFGMKEGRVPGADLPGTVYDTVFDPNAYLARYPDVRGIDEVTGKISAYAANPLKHWQLYGMAQGRKPGYELVSTNTPAGMTSPGTVKQVASTGAVNNGDMSSLIAMNPVDLTTTPSANDLTVTVAQNSGLILGLLALGGLIFFANKKKKKKLAI